MMRFLIGFPSSKRALQQESPETVSPRHTPPVIVMGAGEHGVAMLLAILLVLLVTGIAVSGMHHAGVESAWTGRQRSTARTFYAADGGIAILRGKLSQVPPDTTPLSLNLPNGTVIRTGRSTDATPQNIRIGGYALRPPDGYRINVGEARFVTRAYDAEITATAPDNSLVELQSRFGKLESQ